VPLFLSRCCVTFKRHAVSAPHRPPCFFTLRLIRHTKQAKQHHTKPRKEPKMSGGITKWVVILQVVVMALGANAQEKPEVFVQLGHSGSVNSVSFSPDGKVLASGGEDNTVKLWDVASGKLIRSINAHIDAVNTVAFSPDGKILASGSGGEFGLKEASIKLWDVYNGKFLNELGTTILDRHTSRITSVAFSSDGKYLVSASIDKSIRLWDVSTGKILKILSVDKREIEINVIALSKDRKFLAAGLEGNSYFDYSKNSQITENTIKVWDVMNGKLIWESNAVDSRVVSVAFSPDGKYLVSGELNSKYDRVGGKVKLWDAISGRLLKTIDQNNYYYVNFLQMEDSCSLEIVKL